MTDINGVYLNSAHNKVINSCSGNLLLLGGGKNVWNEYIEAKEFFDKTGYNNGTYQIMCVNDIAGQFKAEPIHHAVSLHKRILPAVRLLRREKSMLEDIVTHSHKAGPQIDIVWDMPNVGGTSGLFAVQVALALGYKKIIVCGVPMDNSGHYYDPDGVNINHATQFDVKSNIMPWRQIASRPMPKVRVRSMSGRTAEVFGKPTEEWAKG